MSRLFARVLAVAFSLALFAGCSNPETPQEVTAAFWQAMAENDAGDVVEYSTLADASAFDGYQRSWTDAVPSYGRVVIDDDEASIVTRVPAESGAAGEQLEIATYLVRVDGQWLVDYGRTGDAIVNPSPFSGILGELNRIGEKLSASFSSSSGQLERDMEQLARDLQIYSQEMSQQAGEAMAEFSEQLQEAMRDLEQSLEEALEDDRQTPEQDRVILEQAARDLDRGANDLNDPTLESLANASRTVAETGERFGRLSEDTLNRYREQWQRDIAEMRNEAESFMAQLRP